MLPVSVAHCIVPDCLPSSAPPVTHGLPAWTAAPMWLHVERATVCEDSVGQRLLLGMLHWKHDSHARDLAWG
eukprot:360043-Chlamydomonas_euryale.AAC.3